jgi:hypothetical protein
VLMMIFKSLIRGTDAELLQNLYFSRTYYNSRWKKHRQTIPSSICGPTQTKIHYRICNWATLWGRLGFWNNNFWRSVTYPGLVLPIPIWAHGCILLTDHRNGCTTITRTLYFSAPMEEVLSTGGLAILAEYQDQAKNSRG